MDLSGVIRKNRTLFLFLAIFILGFFLRTYKLGDVPNGLYQDETAIGYNAYSIIETGKDEYGKSYPLYFKSFGDYKLPVYIYLTTIPVRILGLTDEAPRAVSAFFSIATVGIFYLLIKRLTGRNNLALFAMVLLAINPWHIHYGRATFEVSVSLFLLTFGTYFLLGKKSSYTALVTGILSFVLAIYTYNLTRLLAPILLIVVVFYGKKNFTELTSIKKIIIGAIVIVGILPLLITILRPEGFGSAGGTLITSSAAIQAPLLEMRSYVSDFPLLLQKLLFSSPTQTLWEYVRHIFSYTSVEFFFITGSSHGNHGIGNVGQFYMFEFFTIVLGIIFILFRKEAWRFLVFGWAIVVICVAALTRESPHATRSFFLLFPYITFSAYGLLWILEKISGRGRRFTIASYTIILLFIFYNITYYLTSYYSRFPIFYAQKWNSEDKILADSIKESESKYDKIIVDNSTGLVYTSLLYYLKYNPEEFQRTVIREPDDSEGFSKVKSFGKFEFRKIDWEKDSKLERTLFITKDENIDGGQKIIKKILYPQRPVVINLGQEIHQFPVTDIAYVLSEKN